LKTSEVSTEVESSCYEALLQNSEKFHGKMRKKFLGRLLSMQKLFTGPKALSLQTEHPAFFCQPPMGL
jgi:hypothetical protein